MRSEWTIDTAMQHVLALRDSDSIRNEQRFVAQERAVEYALAASKTATDKADSANEKRFATQALYITRSEVYTLMALACAIASGLGAFIGHILR